MQNDWVNGLKIVNIKWLTHKSEEPEAESMCDSERITEFSGSDNKSRQQGTSSLLTRKLEA